MYGKDEKDTRSKENVKNNGEVFTPFIIVDKMLDLIPESAWVDPSFIFIEPTCGNGQFLVKVFEKRVKAGLTILQALNTMIGMDITKENIQEAKTRLHACAVKEMIAQGIKKDTKEWNELKVKIVAVVKNNIMKVQNSLTVLNDYKNGKGILRAAKFVFEDPTGHDDVMTSINRDIIVKNATKAFASKNETLSPFEVANV